MTPDVGLAAGLGALALFIITGLRAIPPRPRLALDAVCFLAATAILYSRSQGVAISGLFDARSSQALWLKGVTIAWWLFGARLLSAALEVLLRGPSGRVRPRLGSDLLAATIYAATLAIVLGSVLGLPITGALATSGVLAIVLGLALQSTLADVFAGIAVGVDAPFHLTDRVRIGDLAEGVVTGANWRSIRIHTDADDVAIIPNSVVAKAMIYNFSFPSRRRVVSVEVAAPATAAPERVLPTLLEAAMLCPDILAEPAPSAVVSRIGLLRTTYAVSFYAPDSARVGVCKDALMRRARRQMQWSGLLDAGDTDPPRLRLSLLRSLAVFESLTDDRLADLAGRTNVVTLDIGELLFDEGAMDALMYAIVSGVLEVRRGGAEVVGRIGGGDYVGEAAVVNGSAHAVSATALTPVSAVVIARDALASLLREDAALTAAFERSARQGLKRLDRKVAASAAASDDFHGRLTAYFRSLLAQREGTA
jgi:small-conductance mechanosensitive channel/CRP-like cAMP-binding protein